MRDNQELRHPSTCNRSFLGFEVRLASDSRSFGIWKVPVIELSAMETPSCDNEVQPTEFDALSNETWRTLRPNRGDSRREPSPGCDAIAAFQLMTATNTLAP
jgi:hypothetical protein